MRLPDDGNLHSNAWNSETKARAQTRVVTKTSTNLKSQEFEISSSNRTLSKAVVIKNILNCAKLLNPDYAYKSSQSAVSYWISIIFNWQFLWMDFMSKRWNKHSNKTARVVLYPRYHRCRCAFLTGNFFRFETFRMTTESKCSTTTQILLSW